MGPDTGRFTEHVLQVVADIPPGRVMTYGDVAAVLGSRASRAVGQVMARSEGMPWWRVVRATGHPAAGHEAEAVRLLVAEGTPMLGDPARVDLALARYRP